MARLDLAVDVNVSGAEKLNSLGKNVAHGALQVAKWGSIVTGAVGAAGFALGNFASDQNEALSKVNVVFGKSSKAVQDWAETSAEAMGLSETEALSAAGTFGNLFKAMGIGEKPALDMSKSVTELASDLASFNNIGTDEALEKIRAGLVGEAEPLRTLGVNISAARTEAKAMELGFKKVDGQLTASAKAQANYALILEDTKLAQGDFARTSEGMANQQRILGATFQDSLADIGQAFVPIIEKILPVATDLLKGFAAFIVDNMPTIEGIITGIASAVGVAFDFLGKAFAFVADEIIPRVQEAFSGFGGSGNLLAGVFATIGQVVNFVAKNVFPFLLEMVQHVVSFIKTNGPAIGSVLTQAFGAVANVVQVVGPILMNVARVIFPAILTAAGILLGGLDKTFKLIGGIFEVVGNVVKTVVQSITASWDLLLRLTTFIWEAITGVIKGVVNGIIDILNGFFGFLNNLQIGIPQISIPNPFGGGPLVQAGGGTIDPFNIPLIPHLAEGGIIDSPTLALIGERGREAVVPLDQAGKLGGDFHSHITVQGELPFIRSEDDLVRVQQRIAFLEGF